MIRIDPLHLRTKRYESIASAEILADELILSAKDSTEDRGKLPLWRQLEDLGRSVVWFTQLEVGVCLVELEGGDGYKLDLRDDEAVDNLLGRRSRLLLDVSGLPHSVWAPLLKAAYRMQVSTRIVYAEPESYKEHPSPASATVFDLSLTFGGLSPLPGFVRLVGPADDSKCIFVAMLGFEGSRPESLIVHIDPAPRAIPVVGVPGFQLEYPSFAVACNRVFLDEYRAHSEIKFARASCPFEVIDLLKKIRRSYPDHYMYLAPVGTKPHAVGAILYAIHNPDFTEVLFDHPVRKVGRTSGVGVVHIYDFGKFLDV